MRPQGCRTCAACGLSLSAIAGAFLCAGAAGCTSYPLLGIFDTGRSRSAFGVVSASVTGGAFSEELIQERTFTDGTSVTTLTYRAGDRSRTRLGIDFNGDGKIDPVIGYGADQAVLQILLSRGPVGTVSFISLTLDSKRDMTNLADVAVGDIDGDGALDIVAAADSAVWYFHHPAGRPTTDMAAWGNPDPDDPLRERIDASYRQISPEELTALITQAVGPGIDLSNYIITVERRYANVEIADMDNDGDNDVIASDSFRILLTPLPGLPLDPIEINDGDVVVFINPGATASGVGWAQVSAGRHERQQRLDRDRAAGLLVWDLDGDGDLDIVSSARADNNVQVSWFENPGPPLDPQAGWTQWRIGSVRDAWSIELGDVTGDGRVDVLAVGGEQMQLLLFEQPADGPKRPYDWDTHVLASFRTFEPRSVIALDVDNDGTLEAVVGGTAGAVRLFEPGLDVRGTWSSSIVLTYDPPGDVGLLGYGDLDGDGDYDLVTVVRSDEPNESRASWIRNETIR